MRTIFVGELTLLGGARRLLAAQAGLSTYHAVLPWTYPLYYVALFVPRTLDDEVQMRAKYGADFEAYAKLVPSRIIPGVW